MREPSRFVNEVPGERGQRRTQRRRARSPAAPEANPATVLHWYKALDRTWRLKMPAARAWKLALAWREGDAGGWRGARTIQPAPDRPHKRHVSWGRARRNGVFCRTRPASCGRPDNITLENVGGVPCETQDGDRGARKPLCAASFHGSWRCWRFSSVVAGGYAGLCQAWGKRADRAPRPS